MYVYMSASEFGILDFILYNYALHVSDYSCFQVYVCIYDIHIDA